MHNFPQKVDDFFLLVVINIQAKTTKLTTSKTPPPSKNSPKNSTPCSARGALTTVTPINYAPQFFLRLEGMHLHTVHPWLRLCIKNKTTGDTIIH